MKTPNDLSYFELQERMEKPGCPVCRIIEEKINGWFQTLLYENITNRDFRWKFLKASGFCKQHNYRFLSYGDSLAASILYRNLADKFIDMIGKGKKDIHAGPCPVCLYLKDIDRLYLFELFRFLSVDAFQSAWKRSDGLCMFHFLKLRKQSKKIPAWFNDFQMERFRIKLDEVDRFINSCNDSVPEEGEVNEKAWREIVELISGRPDTTG